MKSESVLEAQTYMCMSPPQHSEEMRRAAERYEKKDFQLKQTLNYCMSGRVDLKRADIGDVGKQDLEKLNLRSAWRAADKCGVPELVRRPNSADQNTFQFRPSLPPSWLKHDRETLRFYAYFQEAVRNSPTENYRVRYCVVLYYLEDGTMQILEPKVENGGLAQGAFLKRHKFPKVDGSGFLSLHDLKKCVQLGTDLTIYNRVFRVVDCDEFTRWLLLQCNVDVGAPEKALSDDFFDNEVTRRGQFLMTRRLAPKDVKESREYTEIILGGSRKATGLRQYLDNDRKVLCFFCYWDDKTAYGMRNYYLLHYFLADDTVEILECYFPNSGKTRFSAFFKRQRLPKSPLAASCPGVDQKEAEYYKPEDFKTGSHVTVYGRVFHLYDCDDFTREFYRKYLGIVQKAEIIKEDVKEPPRTQWSPLAVNIGSKEDTLASCLHIVHSTSVMACIEQAPRLTIAKCHRCKCGRQIPRRPLKNEREFLFGEDAALVFRATLLHKNREDEGRVFIITVRERDDVISVFESRGRSAGHAGGKFAEAGKKINPFTKQPYTAADLYIGSTINIHGLSFLLVDADNRTIEHMEQHPLKYPVTNLQRIRSKISGIVQALKPHELMTLRSHLFHPESGEPTSNEKQESDLVQPASRPPGVGTEKECTLVPYKAYVNSYPSRHCTVPLVALLN